MDDIVKQALKKWPHVPHCYDWLALDARGDWYMRDERVQSAGPFPRIKGSRILHEKLREFIARNYLCDAAGCWFFQNGPQRVYVELERAPWIWRLTRSGAKVQLESHTGRAAQFESAFIDEDGHLYLAADLGLGLVHSLDMDLASDAIDRAEWAVNELPFAELTRRFGHALSPAARHAAG